MWIVGIMVVVVLTKEHQCPAACWGETGDGG